MKTLHWLAYVSQLSVVVGCAAAPDGAETVGSTEEPITAVFSGSMGQFGVTGATDVATVSRGAGLLDLFTLGSGVRFYRYDGSWHSPVTISPPSGVAFSAVAAANNNNRLEVVATGTNHRVYYNHSTSSGTGALTFGTWTQIASSAFGFANTLALTCWGSGRLDAFWITQSGFIGHAWGVNSLSDGLESGDTPSLTYLRPLFPSAANSLNAVSWGPGRIDILMARGSSSQNIQHHWYDANAGEWGSGSSLHREAKSMFKSDGGSFTTPPNDLAVLTPGPGLFEIYTVDRGSGVVNEVDHTTFSNVTGWPGFVYFDRVNGTGNEVPATVKDAIFWNGNRHDVFNASSDLYQLFY
jgi:hypothetical protein